MRKHLALTVLILVVLSIMVSCAKDPDPVFRTVTIKNESETVGTEKVKDGDTYALPKEYKGIENLQGWKIGDDETVYEGGHEIKVTEDITINAYTLQPYFDYEDLGEFGWEVTLKDEYRNTVTDVVIPSSYEGKPVVMVDGFDKAVNMTSVTFPDTLIAISGFYNCTSLKSVVIPKSVTVLGDGCFCNCTSLESVTFEEGSELEAIGKDGCFQNSKITSITLPEGLESIGASCFAGCSQLTSISIPNSVYEMEYSVFSRINDKAVITIDRVENSIVEDDTYDWGTPSTATITWTGKKTTYTITYKPNGATGESFTTEAVDFGTKVTIESLPEGWAKEGYTFDGWHQRQDGDTHYSKDYVAGEEYTGPTMTLYAQWVPSKS